MRLLLLVVVTVCLLIALAPEIWRKLEERSLAQADQLELRATYDRWMEAGRPQGDKLSEFMHGRRADLVVSNRSLTVNGTNYVTQFALTQSKSGWAGTLFVTTNRVLIWLDSADRPKLVSPKDKFL